LTNNYFSRRGGVVFVDPQSTGFSPFSRATREQPGSPELAAIAGGEVADKLDSVMLVINSESLTDMANFRLAVM